MASGPNLGVAYLTLLPTMKGSSRIIEQELGGVPAERIGGKISTRLTAGMKGLATAGMAAVGTAAGIALAKGFGRLKAIDQAQAKLKGLGSDTKTVEKVMKNASAAVQGTAFGLDAAATAAAGAMAAGIKPGAALEKNLKLVADAATIAGTDMGSMGAIFNKVAASNKVQMDVINQLHDAGVPALSFLAKTMGVTAGEASKMASAGKIDFATFQKAMEQGLGGAALSSGNTFSGAMANVLASLGRTGAGIMSGVFPKLAPLFQRIQAALAPVEAKAKELGTAIGNIVAPALDKFMSLLEGGAGQLSAVKGVLGPVTGVFVALGSSGLAPLIGMVPGLGGLASKLSLLGGPLGLVAGGFLGLVATSPQLRAALGELFGVVGQAVQAVMPALTAITTVLSGVATAALRDFATFLAGAVQEVAGGVRAMGAAFQAGGDDVTSSGLPGFFERLGLVARRLYDFAVGTLVPGVRAMVAAFQAGGSDVTSSGFAGFMERVGLAARALADWLTQSVVPALGGLVKWATQTTGVIEGLAIAIGGGIVAVKAWQVGTAAFNAVATAARAGIAAWKGIQLGWNAATYGAAGASYASTAAAKAGLVAHRAVNVVLAAGRIAWGLLNGSLIKSAAGWVANTSAMVAQKAALIASTVATNGAAIAQRALNLAMRANPLGLIVTAITAVVGALTWFFTKTETGKKMWAEFSRFLGEAWANISAFFKSAYENVIKPVFDAIGTAAKWVFENILAPGFRIAQTAFAIMAGIFQGVYESILKPVFDGIGALFSWIWQNIVQPYVGFVKLQIQALGAVFSWLYENAVKPVFAAIGTAFDWIYQNIIQPVVNFVKLEIRGWGIIMNWLYANAIKPAFDAIGRIFGWINNTIIKPIVGQIQANIRAAGAVFTWLYQNAVKPAWDAISGTISTVWNKGIKPVIDTLVKIITSEPKKAFELARDAVGKAWKGIQDLAAAPVRFVVDVVLGSLVDAVNLIPGVNLKKPKLPKGFSDGGYTGALPRDAVAGVVHGDEHVIRAASRRSIESRHPGLLDHMNRFGTVPGYRKGGLVNPLPAGSYSVSQPFHAGHNGMDLAAPAGTPIRAAADGVAQLVGSVPMGGNEIYLQHRGLGTRYSHLSRFSTREGQSVKQGNVIGYVGATGMATGPHLHYMVHDPGDGGNGRAYRNFVNPAPYLSGQGKQLGEAWNPLTGLIDTVAAQIKKQFPGGGMWVDAAAGIAKQTAQAVVRVFTPKIGTDTGSTGPKLYDRGGIIPHGGTGVNLSGKPEAVLTNDEMRGFKSIIAALSGGGQLPGSIGSNILAGLTGGLRGGASSAVQAMHAITSALVDTANRDLEIHSPSRVFKKVGTYIGAGLQAGITGSVSATKSATQRLVKSVTDAFDHLTDQRAAVQKQLSTALVRQADLRDATRAKRQGLDALLRNPKAKTSQIDTARRALAQAQRREAAGARNVADLSGQRRALDALAGPAGAGRRAALIKSLEAQTKRLNTIAVQRADVAKRLADAQKRLAAVEAQKAEYAGGIRSNINALGGIAGKTSVEGMVANLQKRLAATRSFTDSIGKLRAMGLDNGSIKELTDAFAQSGSTKTVDALVAGGKGGVKQIVDLRKQLDAAGGKLGNQVGEVLYQAGLDAARGLVQGLKSQEKALQAQAKRIADAITATVKKTLKIKSPSRVMAALGGFTGEGFAVGLDGMLPRVEASARTLAGLPGAYAADAAEQFARSPLRPSASARQVEADRVQPPAIYVRDPFTGDYLLAQVDSRAEQTVDRALAPVSRRGLRAELGGR